MFRNKMNWIRCFVNTSVKISRIIFLFFLFVWFFVCILKMMYILICFFLFVFVFWLFWMGLCTSILRMSLISSRRMFFWWLFFLCFCILFFCFICIWCICIVFEVVSMWVRYCDIVMGGCVCVFGWLKFVWMGYLYFCWCVFVFLLCLWGGMLGCLCILWESWWWFFCVCEVVLWFDCVMCVVWWGCGRRLRRLRVYCYYLKWWCMCVIKY